MTATEHLPSPSANGDREVYGHRFASLNEALREHRIPLENWNLIVQLTTIVGVHAYYGTTSYIKALRNDGAPDLHIHYGWTDGFQSEDEARRATGDASIWPSDRGTGQWGVEMIMRAVPMGRMGQPEEVADVMAFLASDDARYVTGTIVTVDGGWRA